MIPTKIQWKKWTLPSKYSYISILIGGISIVYAIYSSYEQNNTIKHLQKKLVDKSNKLESSQVENLKLSKEISKITSRFSDRMTGGDSIMYLSSFPNSLMLSYKGDQPLRDVNLEIKNENDFSKRIKYITDNNGANIGGEEALSYLNKSIIYQHIFKVINPPVKESISHVVNIKDPEIGEKAHYSYRATALNGVFTGHIYIFHRSDNKILRSRIGYHDNKLIKEFPENYPKLNGDTFEPDFNKFKL